MNTLFRSIIKALLICVITAAVLIFIFAFIANSSQDSTKNIRLYSMAAFFVSAFSGALTASLSAEGNKLTASMLFGGLFIIICLALSMLFGGAKLSEAWISYLAVMAICFLSALIAGKKRPKKPKGIKKLKKIMKKG